jgi:hypothetical protein
VLQARGVGSEPTQKRKSRHLRELQAGVALHGGLPVAWGSLLKLSRYDVSLSQDAAKLKAATNPRLFATPYRTTQPKLFALDPLGEGGWLKALRLAGYAARARRRPEALQQALFPYLEAL